MKSIKYRMLQLSASVSVLLMSSVDSASAAATGESVTQGMVETIGFLPQLIKTLAYLAGLTIGLLGVLKIKDHVENPANAPLKDGAIRLATGAALLASPTLFDVMVSGLGAEGGGQGVRDMDNITFTP